MTEQIYFTIGAFIGGAGILAWFVIAILGGLFEEVKNYLTGRNYDTEEIGGELGVGIFVGPLVIFLVLWVGWVVVIPALIILGVAKLIRTYFIINTKLQETNRNENQD